jgi:hypothetical protein
MYHCPYCGSEQPNYAHFCGHCGRVTTRRADAPATFRRSHRQPADLFDADLADFDKENIPTLPLSSSYRERSQRTRPTQVPAQRIPSTPFPEQEEGDEAANLYHAHYQAPFYNAPTLAYDLPQEQSVQSAYQPYQPLIEPPVPPIAPMTPRRYQNPPQNTGLRHSGCLVVLLVATCLLFISTCVGSFFLFVLTPTLTVSSSAVTAGGTFAVHGSHFLPTSIVTFTVDAGLPVALATQQTGSAPQTSSLTADANGNFTTTLVVNASWSPGVHILHATETTAFTTRQATLPFTVNALNAQAPQLSMSLTTLSFGTIEKGKKATLAFTMSNNGGSPAHWSITTGSASWLSVDMSSGALAPGAPPQVIHVTCDSSALALGSYSAIVGITSDGGNSGVRVTVEIVPPTAIQQAILSVAPQTLAFQPMPAGQAASLPITIGNTGTLALTWQAAFNNAPWATLDMQSGTLQSGDAPQTVHVTVDTTNLSAGNYSAALSVSSNGGSAQVTITLIVTGATPSAPTPTPTAPPAPAPTPPPAAAQPTLLVTPSSFTGNTCAYSTQQGWTCTAMVSNPSGNTSNLNWSTSSSGPSLASFSPARGSLAPGSNAAVTIQIPANTICPSKVLLAFSGPTNTVSVPWNCGTPTLTASPTTLTTNDCTAVSNGWQCTVTLSDDMGGLNWSASSNLNATFSASSGTVYAGTPATITILIPTCTPGNISFTGPGNTVTLSWACSNS